jgi:hypothetical protein
METIGPNTSSVRTPTGTTTSLVQTFLDFLSDPNTSIPLNSNFFIEFTIPNQVLQTNTNESYENLEPSANDWKRLSEKRKYLISKHQYGDIKNGVSFFANGVVLPQESFGVERGTVLNNTGLLAGVISSNRSQQGSLRTTFLETETSFIDLVLRPWIILGSQYGLIARGSKTNIKTNLTVFIYSKQLKKNSNDLPPVEVRKIYNFYGCVPVSVEDGGYAKHDWGKNSSLPVATVSWAYNYYTISSPENTILEY